MINNNNLIVLVLVVVEFVDELVAFDVGGGVVQGLDDMVLLELFGLA